MKAEVTREDRRRTGGRRRAIGTIISGIVLLMVATGCQSMTKITWDVPPTSPGEKRPLTVGKVAKYPGHFKSGPNTVGRHTFTVFAIPVGEIFSQNGIEERVNKAVTDALRAANYDVAFKSQPPPGQPWLSGILLKFKYWSYSWFWPVMFDGGKIQLTLQLKNPASETVWTHGFTSSSSWVTFGSAHGYDSNIRSAMTKLVLEIKQAVLSDEFREALQEAQSSGPRTSENG